MLLWLFSTDVKNKVNDLRTRVENSRGSFFQSTSASVLQTYFSEVAEDLMMALKGRAVAKGGMSH